jgi:hypothetical protein
MADNKEQLSDDLVKALKNVLSESEYADFMKGNSHEEGETKKEEKEEDDEDSEEQVIEKAFKKAKEDYKAMKTALKSKKAELEKAFPDKFNDEDEEDEIGEKEEKKDTKKPKEVEKSQTPDLVKAFSEALDIKLKDISKANTDLFESLEIIKGENAELKKAIEVMSNQRPGMKSVTRSSFIEKANENQFDESGKVVLSVTKNKAQVEQILDDAFEKAENPTIKNELSSCLLNYNSGGSPIAEPIAKYLYANHNVKLVQ